MAESEEVMDGTETSTENDAANKGGQAEEGAASEESSKGENEEDSTDSKEESEDEQQLDPSKFEPETRKTPTDWYNWRHQKKEEASKEPSKDPEEQDVGELNPAARKYLEDLARDTFGKIAQPVFDTLAKQESERELVSFLTDPSNSHFKKYVPVVRKYMEHPAWQQVPVSAIFHHLDYQNARSNGAEDRKQADIQAKKNRAGGTSARTPEKAEPDYRNLTSAQYEAMRRSVQEGKQITI